MPRIITIVTNELRTILASVIQKLLNENASSVNKVA
jgi:hypothetical protein